jgi:hypothetical protein
MRIGESLSEVAGAGLSRSHGMAVYYYIYIPLAALISFFLPSLFLL